MNDTPKVDVSNTTTNESQPNGNSNTSMSPNVGSFGQVPIEITISVGKARPMISELLSLSKDSVLQLDRKIDDPVELYIGDRLIARGTLAEVDGTESNRLAVRLTDVSDLASGL